MFHKAAKPYVVKIKRGARNQCARNTIPGLCLLCLLQIVCFESLLEKKIFLKGRDKLERLFVIHTI